MKKSLLFIPKIASLIVFSLLLVQCSKDDETPPKTKAELIIGNWQITGDNYSPAYDLGTGSPITDGFVYYSACEKDDITMFKVNSQGEFNEGATKCDPTDPQTIAFLYTLTNGDTKLNLNSIAEFDIVQLDNGTMKLSNTFSENGVSYTETLTFTRK